MYDKCLILNRYEAEIWKESFQENHCVQQITVSLFSVSNSLMYPNSLESTLVQIFVVDMLW